MNAKNHNNLKATYAQRSFKSTAGSWGPISYFLAFMLFCSALSKSELLVELVRGRSSTPAAAGSGVWRGNRGASAERRTGACARAKFTLAEGARYDVSNDVTTYCTTFLRFHSCL